MQVFRRTDEPQFGAMAGHHAVTLQLGLEGTMSFQQVQGGCVQEHRDYLGVLHDHLDRVDLP
jgi:hypothetical protein